MTYGFRNALPSEAPQIWFILQQAIRRRKEEGSDQWQDGYPNPEVVQNDIERGIGFVLTGAGKVVGYCAVLINDEPQYTTIDGKWLTDGDFVVFHRVAIAESHLRKGLASQLLDEIEAFALENSIPSVRADTNYDNIGMLRIFDKKGYSYCGKVYFRGNPRRAYEKVLSATV